MKDKKVFSYEDINTIPGYMNEMYAYRNENEGFIHYVPEDYNFDIDTNLYPEPKDIIVLFRNEIEKLYQINGILCRYEE